MKYQKFINNAIAEAKKSKMRSQFGAILIYGNKIISRGYNRSTFISSKLKDCLL